MDKMAIITCSAHKEAVTDRKRGHEPQVGHKALSSGVTLSDIVTRVLRVLWEQIVYLALQIRIVCTHS